MDAVIIVFFVWLVITLVGHASWLIVRNVLQAIGSIGQPSADGAKRSTGPESDIQVARRVVLRMHDEHRIKAETTGELLRALQASELHQPVQSRPATAPLAQGRSATARPASTSEPLSAGVPTAAARPAQAAAVPATATAKPADVQPAAASPDDAAPIDAILVTEATSVPSAPSTSSGESPRHRSTGRTPEPRAEVPKAAPRGAAARGAPARVSASPSVATPATPAAPSLSASEIIQSFLSAHNIRWGELVAGVLIVVCSIGLVRSLWSSLVESHPVAPSLIFLGFNAAIYAAGLYTLSRWRLRHTSRAVLVIATLLVPLSVLAGLAAAGTHADAVQLNNPITLIAILIAGTVYSSLLYLGGKALSRRSHAVSMVAAVAGPLLTLPLAPAAIRNFEGQAGWLIAIGSASIFLANALISRLHRAEVTSIGPAGGRVRLLVMGFSGFSMAVAVTYLAFKLRQFGNVAMLPLGIAAIPGIMSLAGSGRFLMVHARSSTTSMIGAVLLVMLIVLASISMPMAMISPSWLWSWALSFGLSAGAVGYLFRQPRWLAASTAPIGLAAVLTSKVWLAGTEWSLASLWSRLFSGEAMIASLMMTALCGVMFALARQPQRRRSMEYATILWGALTLALAAVVSVGPQRWLGEVVPAWAVSMVLIAAVAASYLYSLRDYRFGYASAVAVGFAWSSLVRPATWFSADAVTNWMLLLSCSAVTLLAMRELAHWLASRKPLEVRIGAKPSEASRAGGLWVRICYGVALAAATAALLGVNTSWTASALTLGGVALIALWAATITGSIESLRGSQLASGALAAVVGYSKFDDWLLSSEAWANGSAFWCWAITAGLVATLWWAIREAARWSVNRVSAPATDASADAAQVGFAQVGFVQRRIRPLVGARVEPLNMPDGWFAGMATGCLGLGAAYFFASLAMRIGTDSLQRYEPSWGLPLAAIGIVGIVNRAMRRHEDSIGRLTSWLITSAIIAAITWLSCQIGAMLPWTDSGRLIAATTIVSAGLVATRLLSDRREQIGTGSAFPTAALVVSVLVIGIASAALLAEDWLRPIMADQLADRTSTIAVSVWWLVASLGLLWNAHRMAQPVGGAASVLLFSAATAIEVPAFSHALPSVWVQVAGLAAIVWIGLTRWRREHEHRAALQPAIDGALALAIILGVITAVCVTTSLTLDVDLLEPAFGYAGFLLSAVSATLWCVEPLRGWLRGVSSQLSENSQTKKSFHRSGSDWSISWPVAISLLAGQLAWLLAEFGWISGIQVVETVVAVWVATSLAALWTYRKSESPIDFMHVAGVAAASFWFAMALGSRSEWMPWFALVGLVSGGMQVSLVAIGKQTQSTRIWFARLLGWFIAGSGAVLLLTRFIDANDASQFWTAISLWLVTWLVVWRWSTRETAEDSPQGIKPAFAIPDLELAAAVMLTAALETLYRVIDVWPSGSPSWTSNYLLWVRLPAFLIASGTAIWHASRTAVWTLAIGTLVAAASLIAVTVSSELGASISQQIAWGAVSCGFVIAFLSHWLPLIARQIGRFTHASANRYFGGMVQSTWINSVVIAAIGTAVAIGMMLTGFPSGDIHLTIATVALAGWAIAEMADEGNLARLRYAAVGVGLLSIGLWASVSSEMTSHPVLAASMRWLVATVLVIPSLLFVVPKLLGPQHAERWRDALRMGTKVAAATSVGSLTSMLAMECMLRDAKGVSGVPLAIVVGVAITLATLSGLCGLVAILSGPHSAWRQRLDLTDRQRIVLIVLAQVVGMLAWLHTFLCQPDWAFVGLRGYWPYIVMVLAFATVGITEWARRRGDEVMSSTLKQTALYLPLIPVLGFWLSGSTNQFEWVFSGGRVRYDVLLALGTIYYIGIASLWKGVMPRVTAIVLGNAAWWALLVQWPGWGFLSHPQVWLIPPALCVLVVSHFYRERLGPQLASAIRYGATLLIYVSSTADMLIQEIGSTLWGPIILILLALAGMLAGVVLRVQPFLYLGAAFVFLGVTSMVWHAHAAWGAVWLWWVFGITTGLFLLAGLMALERYKTQLRRYATELASWER